MSELHLVTPIRYHFATTRRLLDLAAQLDEADYLSEDGYSANGVHGTLAHLAVVANAWRTALETGKQGLSFQRDTLSSLAAVRDRHEIEEREWIELVSGYTAADALVKRDLVNYRGDPVSFHLWHVLQHFVLHGMQHHSELARMLTDKGLSPGNIDFLYHVP
jgi:uncharacterized damage-inducible protein DinB